MATPSRSGITHAVSELEGGKRFPGIVPGGCRNERNIKKIGYEESIRCVLLCWKNEYWWGGIVRSGRTLPHDKEAVIVRLDLKR